MKNSIRFMAMALVGVLLLLGVACTQAATPTPTSTGGGNTSTLPSGGGTSQNNTGFAPSSYNQSAYYQQAYGGQQSGIWVTGTGRTVVTPDLVILSLGVESRAATVAQARDQAATAMDNVMKVLTASGIKKDDIQTQYFNIQPQYVWNDFAKRQEINGYVVTNTITVKVRNVEGVGTVIDKVADAGGDLVRINNVSFTVEKPDTYVAQAREAAVKDAMAKAKQFADLTGVTLGKISYIAEAGGNIPVARDYAEAKAMTAGAAAPTTPISPGTLDITMTVQAVFNVM